MTEPCFVKPPEKPLSRIELHWFHKEIKQFAQRTNISVSDLAPLRLKLWNHVLEWAGFPEDFRREIQPDLNFNAGRQISNAFLRYHASNADPYSRERILVLARTISEAKGDVMFDYPYTAVFLSRGRLQHDALSLRNNLLSHVPTEHASELDDSFSGL
jgi:hypothetical protein